MAIVVWLSISALMKKDLTRWLQILLFFSPPSRCKIFLFFMRPDGLIQNKKILHRSGGEKNNKILSHLVSSFFMRLKYSTRLRSPLKSTILRQLNDVILILIKIFLFYGAILFKGTDSSDIHSTFLSKCAHPMYININYAILAAFGCSLREH